MGHTHSSVSEHTQKALDWESDRIASLEKSENRAWWIARGAAVCMFLALAALVIMIPFYKVVPITFQVDKVTGESLMVNTAPTSINPTEAMSKYWVARYVQMRERYIWKILQLDFDAVRALSAGKVEKDYIALFQGENALNKKLGENTQMTIDIVSVTLPPGEANKAIVRFERTTNKNGVEKETHAKFIATLSFTYEQHPLFTKEREIIDNPLGFKVDGYVVDSESR